MEEPQKKTKLTPKHTLMSLVVLAMLSLIVLSIGMPSSTGRPLYQKCIAQSKTTLNQDSTSCLNKFKKGSKGARACVEKAKNQKSKRDIACKKLLKENLPTQTTTPEIPTPLPTTPNNSKLIASSGICLVNSAATWKSCIEKINSATVNTVDVRESFNCKATDSCNVNISNIRGPIVIRGKDSSAIRISRQANYKDPILNISRCSNVKVQGITFDDLVNNSCPDCKSPQITVTESEDVAFEQVKFTGAKKVSLALAKSSKITVQASEFSEVQGTGIWVPALLHGKPAISSQININANIFTKIDLEAINFAAQSEGSISSQIKGNSFSNSSVGVVLQDPVKNVEISNNIFSDLTNESKGHAILVNTDVKPQPMQGSVLAINKNQFINLAGWGILRESKESSFCPGINISNNTVSNVRCNNNSKCKQLNAVKFDCLNTRTSASATLNCPSLPSPSVDLSTIRYWFGYWMRGHNLFMSGFDGDWNYSLDGKLPPGLYIKNNDARLVIYGTATAFGTYTVDLKITPKNTSCENSKTFTITMEVTCKVPGTYDCDNKSDNGCESKLNERWNCGSCGVSCDDKISCTTDYCSNGQCQHLIPPPNFRYLDGDGTDVDANGQTIEISYCNSGPTPSCPQGYNIFGSATCDIVSDYCRISCERGCPSDCSFPNASGVCQNGGCHLATCNPGYKDCNGNPNDGCEVDIGGDVNNCGDCGNSCDDNNACTTNRCENGRCITVSPVNEWDVNNNGSIIAKFYCRDSAQPTCNGGYRLEGPWKHSTMTDVDQVNCIKNE